ncbi:ATP-binding protein [Rhizobium sp. L1K21]|uniref:PAS domain-containing sensor histidine kinase n=1 Tax=Rhizobium sp. L1K21 TaxID=2954933 RepID=UPI0020925EC8|nr:ATP-binding protein [Rhizobium sp. L1K21]MCO6184624.1 ATP-binding protein [Rhizobium sp. L1K21]
MNKVGMPSIPSLDDAGESLWLDVIHRMDEVYAELLKNEADLERKNADLEEAQSFISSVVASVSDILIVCSSSGVIKKVNPAFLSMVGRLEPEVVGSSVFNYIAEGDQDNARRVIGAGQEGQLVEADILFLRADGNEECLAMRCAKLADSHSRQFGAVLTGRPISELRRAYQALHEAHKELQTAQHRLIEQEKMASLGRLVAGVAHELNNPISFVYANIYTLDRYRKKLVQYLEAIHRGAEEEETAALRRELKIDSILADFDPLLDGTIEGASRVSDIVKNLRRLSFSRAGERQTVDLDRLLRNSVQLAAKSKNTSAKIVFDSVPTVMSNADEGQLHQVFVNLIDNAFDAVADVPTPLVEIVMKREKGLVRIDIRDNGPGIAKENLSKIFEPFFTTKTIGEGTGLGLWISFTIIEDHGGRIEVSNRPDGGAEFSVILDAG